MDEQQNIRALLDKYEAGRTSPEEEVRLIRYFKMHTDLGEWEVFRSQLLHADAWQNQAAEEAFKARLLRQFSEGKKETPVFRFSRQWINIAAGLLLLLSGFGLGRLGVGSQKKSQKQEMVALQTELESLRTMMIVALFDQPRASERIRAVRMAEELRRPADEAVQLLLRAMKEDDNLNVRLASIKALYAFRASPQVQQAFLMALSTESSPIVQLELLRIVEQLDMDRKDSFLLNLLEQNLDERVKEQIQLQLKTS